MDELTIPIPDGLDEGQKARLAEQLSHIASETVREQGLKPKTQGSLMDLAGCFPYDGPAVSKEDARAAARQHVADNFIRENG